MVPAITCIAMRLKARLNVNKSEWTIARFTFSVFSHDRFLLRKTRPFPLYPKQRTDRKRCATGSPSVTRSYTDPEWVNDRGRPPFLPFSRDAAAFAGVLNLPL